MTTAYIFDAIRTPIGKKDGGLRGYRADEMAADLLKALVERNKIRAGDVEDVILGCVTQTGEQGVNIARNAALAAGFPVTVPGTSVNRLCASGLQACNFAAMAVQSGQADLVVAGGAESMTRVPMGSDMGEFSDRIRERFDLVPQGIAAEFLADRWNLSREELDEFSLESHRKALATDPADEILPIGGLSKDEGPRPDTSLEKIAALEPAFKPGGKITAGNSSQISDGAAVLLIGSPKAAERFGLKPRARFVATAAVGVDPTLMLTGPIPATLKVLDRAGLDLSRIDLFECNEAFAPVPLVWMRELRIEPERINVGGGAIALGHPLGCTGARLLTTLLHQMERRDARWGLVTLCIGLGQGAATIIERIP